MVDLILPTTLEHVTLRTSEPDDELHTLNSMETSSYDAEIPTGQLTPVPPRPQ